MTQDTFIPAGEFSPEQAATMARWAVEDRHLTQAQADAMLAPAGAAPAPNGVPAPAAISEQLPADVGARLAAGGITPAADIGQYQLPVLTAGEHTPEVHAFDVNARGWMHSARLSPEHGSAVASAAAEIAPRWAAMSPAEQTLYTEEARSQLARLGIGDDQIALARRLVRAVEAQRPGLNAYLESTGAGSHPMVVSLLARHAAVIFGEGGNGNP